MLRSKAEGLLGVASAFSDCDIPDADLGQKLMVGLIGIRILSEWS